MRRFSLPILLTLTLTLGFCLSATQALALVAANTQIFNQATLTYNDGTGDKTATAAVTVSVALVPSPPNIAAPPAQTASYNGPASSIPSTFIITSTSNGPDTYAITAAVTASTNTSGAGAAYSGGPVELGATVTTVGSTTTSLVVPADGTADSIVNGIQAGDTVVVNGESLAVQSVIDNATGTSTIILSSALGSAPGAGTLVAERKTVPVAVTAGTIITVGTELSVSAGITATSGTDAAVTVTSVAITNTFTSGVATLAKYVRNVTQAMAGTSAYSYGGETYYAGGVAARPNDVLEYLLIAANSGAGAVSGAVITDILPTGFVTLAVNAYGVGRAVTYVNDTGVVSTLSAAADADAANYNGATQTLTVNVGTGATNAAGGSIPGGDKNVLALYRVSVNP